MKIIVCVKVIAGELNPFDECAVENALRLSNDVTVISMCPPSAEKVLKPLTRLGVKVMLLSDSLYAGSDTLATARILSSQISKMSYDLIICGRQSTDGDTAQVGPCLSALLGISLMTNAMTLEYDGGSIEGNTRFGEERVSLPALVTVERNCVLRFPSIFSKESEIERLTNKEVGCKEEYCGLEGSPTKVLKTFENERGKRSCTFIGMEELIPLIEKLKKEKNIPDETAQSEECREKLESVVWAIGAEAAKSAAKIAEKVVIIEESDPRKIAEMIKAENPETVLWNADLQGRRDAPVAAALVGTGLCADCTYLEASDGELYMYRPARSGNITAKIKCTTRPQMATVRGEGSSGGIIVAGGRGVSESFGRIREFAENIGAELGASRAAVDASAAPYEAQIGLTGKSVSPDIYVAIGISGAVQHTCAIENSRIVIAVNPDKDAKIFDYADYGVIAEF